MIALRIKYSDNGDICEIRKINKAPKNGDCFVQFYDKADRETRIKQICDDYGLTKQKGKWCK